MWCPGKHAFPLAGGTAGVYRAGANHRACPAASETKRRRLRKRSPRWAVRKEVMSIEGRSAAKHVDAVSRCPRTPGAASAGKGGERRGHYLLRKLPRPEAAPCRSLN